MRSRFEWSGATALRVFLALSLVLAAVLLPAAARADYPDRPIRLVVPFPPGGGADNLARMIMPHVAQILGVQIVIDNKPGAGGNIGAELVAHSPPDGYTLLYGTNGTHAINQTLYRSLRFDPVADFAPVSRMTLIAAMLFVNNDLPVRSVSELIAYAKANPGKLNFASAGNGTTSHLAGELFRTMADVDIVHVPYRGGGAAALGVVGGQVQMMIDVMPNAYPLVKGDKVRGLAVTTARRFPGAPDVPTMAEAGVPGFDVSAWDAIFAPAGTPPQAIRTLNAAIRQALDEPALREQLQAAGALAVAGSAEDLARHVATESEKWSKVVRASGAKID